jgi:hypothetical protein
VTTRSFEPNQPAITSTGAALEHDVDGVREQAVLVSYVVKSGWCTNTTTLAVSSSSVIHTGQGSFSVPSIPVVPWSGSPRHAYTDPRSLFRRRPSSRISAPGTGAPSSSFTR